MANYVDYEEKLGQIDAQRIKLVNKLNKDKRKAYDDACFYVGKMILSCYGDNPECIVYEGLHSFCQALDKSIKDKTQRARFYKEEEGIRPGATLSEFREKVKAGKIK